LGRQEQERLDPPKTVVGNENEFLVSSDASILFCIVEHQASMTPRHKMRRRAIKLRV